MPLLIDTSNVINDNAFEFEQKLSSRVTQYQETAPTPVTYYHLCNDDTTTDVGFHDVESLIGTRSPVKFKKIKNLPISGLEQMVVQLEDSDKGLDSSFQGEATISPNTIKPLQNSYFKIPYLNGYYLFRITEVDYDILVPNGFYKIGYKLESVDEDTYNKIDYQLCGSYICNSGNIGTESTVILEEETASLVDKVNIMYKDMVDTYITLFYDRTHNVMIYNDCGRYLYDPLGTMFINKHGLFNDRNQVETYMLTLQFRDALRKIKYEKSVYRFIERRELEYIDNFYFLLKPLTAAESSYAMWGRDDVYFIDYPTSRCESNIISTDKFFSNEFVRNTLDGVIADGSYGKLISSYILNKELSVKDIPLDLNQYLIDFNLSLEVFLLTPIVLYIIRRVVNESLKSISE